MTNINEADPMSKGTSTLISVRPDIQPLQFRARRSPGFISFVTLLLALISIGSTHAATIVVNTLDDELNTDGDCSCREALIAANTDRPFDGCPAGSGADVLTFGDGLAGGTLRLVLTQAVLPIEDSLTIEGRNVTIDGQGNAQMFLVSDRTGNVTPETRTIRVEFHDLTLRGGRGSAIFATGPLSLNSELIVRNCVITANNAAGGSGVAAAGISHLLGSTSIENCTITDNKGDGVLCAVTSRITNTRFSGNSGIGLSSYFNLLNSLTIRDSQLTNTVRYGKTATKIDWWMRPKRNSRA